MTQVELFPDIVARDAAKRRASVAECRARIERAATARALGAAWLLAPTAYRAELEEDYRQRVIALRICDAELARMIANGEGP